MLLLQKPSHNEHLPCKLKKSGRYFYFWTHHTSSDYEDYKTCVNSMPKTVEDTQVFTSVGFALKTAKQNNFQGVQSRFCSPQGCEDLAHQENTEQHTTWELDDQKCLSHNGKYCYVDTADCILTEQHVSEDGTEKTVKTLAHGPDLVPTNESSDVTCKMKCDSDEKVSCDWSFGDMDWTRDWGRALHNGQHTCVSRR